MSRYSPTTPSPGCTASPTGCPAPSTTPPPPAARTSSTMPAPGKQSPSSPGTDHAQPDSPVTCMTPAVAARIRQLAAQAEHRRAIAGFRTRHAADQHQRAATRSDSRARHPPRHPRGHPPSPTDPARAPDRQTSSRLTPRPVHELTRRGHQIARHPSHPGQPGTKTASITKTCRPVNTKHCEAGLGLSEPVHDLREIVNAILYVNRAGCAWHLLPHDFPPYRTVCGYYARWEKDGTTQAIRDLLRVREQAGRAPDPTAAIIDARVVKTS